MELKVTKTVLEEIKAFRTLFLKENNFQFVHNKCHDYRWADDYIFLLNDIKIGYGSVWGLNKREDRDAIFEFYVIKSFRKLSNIVFPAFLSASEAKFIQCQTNDHLLTAMLYEFSRNINAESILFEDHYNTNFAKPSVRFRKRATEEGNAMDVPYIIEQNNEEAASGGLMLNYNMPYADIYMEVKESFRGQGLGALMVQELKKEAYLMGRVPAARCNPKNQISKATLLKAGFKACGFILVGVIGEDRKSVV